MSLHLRARTALAALPACAGLLLTQGTATAAPATTAAETWAAAHGPAATSGTYWGEAGSEPYSWDYVFDGELTNTGGERYTTWFAVVYDLHPARYLKAGSQCGPGTGNADMRVPSWGVPTNVYVTVCRGTEMDFADCAEWEFIATFW